MRGVREGVVSSYQESCWQQLRGSVTVECERLVVHQNSMFNSWGA